MSTVFALSLLAALAGPADPTTPVVPMDNPAPPADVREFRGTPTASTSARWISVHPHANRAARRRAFPRAVARPNFRSVPPAPGRPSMHPMDHSLRGWQNYGVTWSYAELADILGRPVASVRRDAAKGKLDEIERKTVGRTVIFYPSVRQVIRLRARKQGTERWLPQGFYDFQAVR